MKNKNNKKLPKKTRIVIVGGGAGGLELATRLGNKLGKKQLATIILIDATSTHIWKPLLHEVASGVMNVHDNEVNYFAHAHEHHFIFKLGRLENIDREQKSVSLAAEYDAAQQLILPQRQVHYDKLVIALGSKANDFNIPGVKENALFLDTTEQAENFHHHFLTTMYQAQYQDKVVALGHLTIAIIGAGATGVELAAELVHSVNVLTEYGFDHCRLKDHVKIVLIEAAENILPALPTRLSDPILKQLTDLDIQVHTKEMVTAVTKDGLETKAGLRIPAKTVLWAAGIKAPDFLKEIAGLESNRAQQLVVTSYLQTTRDKNIFAIGDCAACPAAKGSDELVPPRAQTAHQQADVLAKTFINQLRGKAMCDFTYKDHGVLVSLSQYGSFGKIMGGWAGSHIIAGKLAQLAYRSLYFMHNVALHGYWRVSLQTFANWLTKPLRPRLKLH